MRPTVRSSEIDNCFVTSLSALVLAGIGAAIGLGSSGLELIATR